MTLTSATLTTSIAPTGLNKADTAFTLSSTTKLTSFNKNGWMTEVCTAPGIYTNTTICFFLDDEVYANCRGATRIGVKNYVGRGIDRICYPTL